ncbi:expansin-like A3 isoform X2 [Tripterygium wilfordii]|uniref:expansin-like A3 isoform X2 n=1 Tax=Tripterygium wilfordii TaxID=458696 RepID=UPI0018F7FCD4|nr:expansin-like A3 isoform X2 [Tripterygium wilfordii]
MHSLGKTRMATLFLYSLFLIFSTASSVKYCGRCVFQSKAAYFPKTADIPFKHGDCGYGPMALGFYSGHIAAASPSLFKDGVGCGGCLQVKCKDPVACGKGVEVVLTGLQNKTNTDLVLSSRAFRAMAKKGMDKNLLKRGTVDVEYKRIPCVYKHHNVSLRVEESSSQPNRLAIKVLYQGRASILGFIREEIWGSMGDE